MRILVSSSSGEEAGRLISSAFKDLGHESSLFLDDNFLPLTFFRWLTSSPFRQTAKRFLQKYKAKAGSKFLKYIQDCKPDLVLVVQGNYFLKKDIKKIRDQHQIPIFNWLVRDPVLTDFFDSFGLINLANYSQIFIADELWLPCVYFFDRPAHFGLLAGNNKIYQPLNLKKDIDILFVGDLFPDPPFTTNGLVYARTLEFLLKNNFVVSALVSHLSTIKKFVAGLDNLHLIREKATPENLNQLYNRSKIVLNLLPLDFKKDLPSKVFDTALSKSFQLVEYKNNLNKIFSEGIVSFRSLDDLAGLLRQYLQIPSERERLAAKVYETALSKHTYQVRAKELLRLMVNYER